MANSPFFSGRIPQHLYDAVERHRRQTGESKTEVLVRALAAYINEPIQPPTQSSSLNSAWKEAIENRISQLEQLVRTSQPGQQTTTVITSDNNVDNDEWLTTKEACERYGEGINQDTFRKLGVNALRERFQLEADLSRRVRGKTDSRWLRRIQ